MWCGHERHRDHGLPCFHCDPRGYIRMVQHLIEKCLVLRMSWDDTVHALARRAGIRPLITLTVWKELLKENRSFFHEYFREISIRPSVCESLRPSYSIH
ncbi:unnamed protein product [Spirodela intermedia]|nr:unnamed protein product [Spirodela intermedia]